MLSSINPDIQNKGKKHRLKFDKTSSLIFTNTFFYKGCHCI